MFYVYLLQSRSFNEIYIGSTNDLRRRLKEHNEGQVISSRRYGPWLLSYYEAYKTERLARLREKRLKQNGNALHELKKRAGILMSGTSRDLSSVTRGGKSGTGFTLVELLIAIAIVGIITTIMVVNFWREGQRGELRQAAEILASNLRKVQNMGMTGQSLSGTVPAGGFGVYFDKITPLADDKYKLFGDQVADGKYVPVNDELIAGGLVNLFKSNRTEIKIFKLSSSRDNGDCDGDGVSDGSAGNFDKMTITFKPPKPVPYVCSQLDEDGQAKTVEIILRQSNPVQCYIITVVGASGQISSERMASCS